MNMQSNEPIRGEKLGQMISEELSDILQKYITKNDRAEIAAITGVGFHTVMKVITRGNTLSRNNSKAVVEMIKLAIVRCDESIIDAGLAKQKLTAYIE